MKRLTFGKAERLSSKREIDNLFSKGQWMKAEGIGVIFQILEYNNGSPLKIGVSVPKKLFRRAVDRNLLKRRMREAIRLHKNALCEKFEKTNFEAHLMFVYQTPEILNYQAIEEKIVLLLNDFGRSASIN